MLTAEITMKQLDHQVDLNMNKLGECTDIEKDDQDLEYTLALRR